MKYMLYSIYSVQKYLIQIYRLIEVYLLLINFHYLLILCLILLLKLDFYVLIIVRVFSYCALVCQAIFTFNAHM